MRTLVSGDLRARSTAAWSARRHVGFLARHLDARRAWNLVRCLAEMKLRRSMPRSHPFYARVEISSACNLRCPGCALGGARDLSAHQGAPRMMTLDDFRHAVRDLLPYLLKVNLYDEGEPLLNPELPEIVAHLTRHDVGACVSTNFSMQLGDDVLRRLVRSGLEHLVVALDGATQETYARYRVGGDLELVLKNVRAITRVARSEPGSRLKVELQFLDFDGDQRERERVSALAEELGAWRLTFVQGRSREGWAGIRFEGTEAERRAKGCYQLWAAVTISASGRLGACDYGEDHGLPPLGNASDYGRARLRNHDAVVALRTAFDPRSARPLNEVCRGCSLVLGR